MLKGTEHYVNHIFYNVLRHIAVPHMCTYAHTHKKTTFPKLDVLQTWNCVALHSSSGLFCFFLCASSSHLDTAFVSYLYSHLCTFLHRASPRQECSSSRRSIRPLSLTKSAPSNTGTRKDKSSALHAYLCTLPVNLRECEYLMNTYRHHGIKH